VKIYSAAGYTIIFIYALACTYSAPPYIGPWTGLLIGAAYFLACWFVGGLYLSPVHPHGDCPPRARLPGVVCKDPHGREQHLWGLHQSGHVGQPAPASPQVFRSSGDPNKLSSDGFWRTLYLCLVPLPVRSQHGQ